ncbi:MAG: hypothetical protein HQL73_09920 [Magnetococcales bacterium]|nr:hypothetical protein [Magnetococcales bacterium]
MSQANLSEEEYLVGMIEELHRGRVPSTTLFGIKFLWTHPRGREWDHFHQQDPVSQAETVAENFIGRGGSRAACLQTSNLHRGCFVLNGRLGLA